MNIEGGFEMLPMFSFGCSTEAGTLRFLSRSQSVGLYALLRLQDLVHPGCSLYGVCLSALQLRESMFCIFVQEIFVLQASIL